MSTVSGAIHHRAGEPVCQEDPNFLEVVMISMADSKSVHGNDDG
jgi:hypothetical protein